MTFNRMYRLFLYLNECHTFFSFLSLDLKIYIYILPVQMLGLTFKQFSFENEFTKHPIEIGDT